MDNFAEGLLATSEWRMFAALAIGLLIGAERERRKGDDEHHVAAGLRTFALIGLLGGLTAQSGDMLLTAAAGLFVGGAALLSYWASDRRDPGLTTEAALVVTFALGVLAQARPTLAMALAVIVTGLLAMRVRLHTLVRDTLTEEELRDVLLFVLASLVVLPLLPNSAIDPFGMVNPFAIWRLVVVLLGLTAAGHFALRLFGSRYGLTLAGLASGIVSSTAAIASMGARARADAGLSIPAAAGGVGSMLGSLLYLIALVAASNLGFAARLALPFVFSVLFLGTYSGWLAWRAHYAEDVAAAPGKAFDLRLALIFGSLVAAFAVLAAGLTYWFGNAGALGSALATGLIDAHAAAVSISTLVTAGRLDPRWASLALLMGLSANMAGKIPMAFATGTRPFAWRVTAAVLLLLAGLWTGFWLDTLR